MYDNTWKSIPEDDMEILQKVLKLDGNKFLEMMEFIKENQESICIGSEYYEWEKKKMNNEYKWKVTHPPICSQRSPSFFKTRKLARFNCKMYNTFLCKGHRVEHNHTTIPYRCVQMQLPIVKTSFWDNYGPKLLKHLKKLERIVEDEYPTSDERYLYAYLLVLNLIEEVERELKREQKNGTIARCV